MEQEKETLQTDETSKVDASLNVNPDNTGKSTSEGDKPTEPSNTNGSEDANVQAKIQEHAELRKKAEEELKLAQEKLSALEEENKTLKGQNFDTRKQSAETRINTALSSSKLPKAYLERVKKDPVKWLLAHADSDLQNPSIEDVENLISENLGGLIGSLEKELGVFNTPSNPRDTFVDTDNAPAMSTGDGQPLSVDAVKNMTPQEYAKLPEETKKQLREAGSKVNPFN